MLPSVFTLEVTLALTPFRITKGASLWYNLDYTRRITYEVVYIQGYTDQPSPDPKITIKIQNYLFQNPKHFLITCFQNIRPSAAFCSSLCLKNTQSRSNLLNIIFFYLNKLSSYTIYTTVYSFTLNLIFM